MFFDSKCSVLGYFLFILVFIFHYKNYKPFAEALWLKKQDELYLNTLHEKNSVGLGQLLAHELETDTSIVEQISMSLLLTITDEKIINYVIENLSINKLNYLNQNWPIILSNLKRNNQKMNNRNTKIESERSKKGT